MGWLRESMEQAGLRSFGELARQALAHPDWPEDSKARPRSLEAILGRLDRREDLDWLADRPGIQQILAELLKLTVSEVRSILMDSPGSRQTVTRLRLDDLRAARSYDLTQEPLPPTIPDRLSLPATWTRCCWLGEHGAGFSLTSQWLTARGLAQCVVIESADDLAQLPLSGAPLYLEAPLELLDATSQWTGTRPLCVALAAEVSRHQLEACRTRGFEPLCSSPVEDSLEQIVDWVLFRLSGRAHSLRGSLLDWLRGAPLAWALLTTLGDVLGWIGAYLDSQGELQRARAKDALLDQWLALRAAELTRERHRDLASLRKSLPDALVAIAEAVLLDDPRSLGSARSVDEWLALVPEHHRRGPDIDWLTTRLVADNLPMRKPDIERAARRLPPGAHRIIVAFRDLGILRPTTAQAFGIRPHFVARLASAIAKDRVVAGTPLFWGEALLRPNTRAALVSTLQTRANSRPESLAEDALEHVDPESPGLVCAFETAFVLLGLAVLEGAELNEQLSASLLEEQEGLLLVDVGPVPLCRMLPTNPVALCDLPGTFYLAAWALSENARMRGGDLASALDPWHAKKLSPRWSSLLDSVARSIELALTEEPTWLPGALKLLDRIRHSIGSHVGESQEPHAVFVCGALLDAIELHVLDFQQFCDWLAVPANRQLFEWTARLRAMATQTLAQGILAAWAEAGKPARGLEKLLVCLPELLAAAPSTLTADLLLADGFEAPEEFLTGLAESAWQAWVEARAHVALDREPLLPWRHAPESAVERAVTSHPPVLDTIRALVWQRFPRIGVRQVERDRKVRPQAAAKWLSAAHAEHAPLMAEFGLGSDWIHANDVVTRSLVQVLHRGIAQRVPEWPRAYELLTRLEAERRRFQPPE